MPPSTEPRQEPNGNSHCTAECNQPPCVRGLKRKETMYGFQEFLRTPSSGKGLSELRPGRQRKIPGFWQPGTKKDWTPGEEGVGTNGPRKQTERGFRAGC